MNFPNTSFRSLAPSLFGVTLALCILLRAQASATPLCEDPSGAPEAAVVGLRAVGDHLEAKLAADPTLGQVTVDLRFDESTILASATVPVSAEGFARVVLPGALIGAEFRDIRYHVDANDVTGAPLMDPYPFLLLFDCLADCSYHVVPGMMTEALVVTEQLSTALGGLSDCNLLPNLVNLISSSDPELTMAAQTLIHQLKLRDLDSLPPDECRHAWQAVIPSELNSWTSVDTMTESANGRHTVSQLFGSESGATASYGLQVTSLKDQPETRVFSGSGGPSTTRVEQSILCLQSAKDCRGPCEGQVDIYLDFARCLETDAVVCASSSEASATAEHSLSYRVNNQVVLDQRTLVSHVEACEDQVCAYDRKRDFVAEAKDGLDRQAQTPAVVNLTGETRLTSSSASTGRDGAAYAVAESEFEYHLELIGSASCTENASAVTQITAPTTTDGDGDGIQMRRWWPDDGFRNPSSGPPVPAMCPPPID